MTGAFLEHILGRIERLERPRPEPASHTGSGRNEQREGDAAAIDRNGPSDRIRRHQTDRFNRMMVVHVFGGVAELADGLGGWVDAVTGAAIGPS